MVFYCPNCRAEVEVESTGTITTNSGRVAYTATCPTCGLDLREFLPPSPTKPATETPTLVTPVTPSATAPSASATIEAYITADEGTLPTEVPPADTSEPEEAVSAQTALDQAAEAVKV